jgi:hypothetical protein
MRLIAYFYCIRYITYLHCAYNISFSSSDFQHYKVYIYYLLFLWCIVYCFADDTVTNRDRILASSTTSYSTRLHPNQNIMTELLSRSKKYNLKAASIVLAVGSVLHCSLRFSNNFYLTTVEGPLEIVSLSGTID